MPAYTPILATLGYIMSPDGASVLMSLAVKPTCSRKHSVGTIRSFRHETADGEITAHVRRLRNGV